MTSTKKTAKSELLSLKEELFCYYYVKSEETFGNGTYSYISAYRPEIEKLNRLKKNGKKSQFDKAYDVCSVEAFRMLRKPKIQERITVLLNELLRDDIVDSQLAKVIMQNRKLDPKIRAISEYNKLKQRVKDKVQLEGDFRISWDSNEKVKVETKSQ